MSQSEKSRVLSYSGARHLTEQECEHVGGAFIIHTAPCNITVLPNGTCTFTGDCEPVPRCKQG